MKVRLREVVDGIEMSAGGGNVAYLDLETGELLGFLTEYFAIAQGYQEGDDLESHPEWGRDMVHDALKVVKNPDAYLCLPDESEFDEYRVMQRFVLGLRDARLLDELADEIRGTGAFRRFRAGIERAGIDQEWYAYRDEAMRQFAREWCRDNGVEWEEHEAKAGGSGSHDRIP